MKHYANIKKQARKEDLYELIWSDFQHIVLSEGECSIWYFFYVKSREGNKAYTNLLKKKQHREDKSETMKLVTYYIPVKGNGKLLEEMDDYRAGTEKTQGGPATSSYSRKEKRTFKNDGVMSRKQQQLQGTPRWSMSDDLSIRID